MSDRDTNAGGPFDSGDPPRDVRLGAMLREVVGAPPSHEVDWPALARRVGAAVRAARPAPWWSYAERWQRRMVPIALAAALVGALTIWGMPSSAPVEVATAAGSTDVLSTLATGGSSADAASSFARSVTSTVDFTTSGAQE